MLYFFGDSLTYGHGLPDCLVDGEHAGPTPSLMSWPSLVSRELEIAYENLARPGCSNQRMLYELRQRSFDKHDIVVIMWSFYRRSFIPRADGLIDIGPWVNDLEHFYEFHDDVALRYQSLMVMEHARLWLAARGLPHIMFSGHEYEDNALDSMVSAHFEYHIIDKALDNMHPGVLSHQSWSQECLAYLRPLVQSVS
jgi:hypothetical protein